MTRDEMIKLIRGIALTAITPFKKDGSIDVDGIDRLIQFLLEKGISDKNGILIPLSTTGNFLSLSLEEKKCVIKAFLKAAADQIPIVVGCNHIRLTETIELAKFAQDQGVVSIMVSPPFYWKPTDDQIINHYHQICESIDIGVIIYNNHWASQVDISLKNLNRILENQNIIGLKESTHSVFKLIQVHRLFADRINIFNGLGEAYEPMYTHLGSKGFTSTLGNIIPELSVKIHSLIVEKKFEEAQQLANQLAPLSDFLDSLTGGQYIAALKHMLSRFGVCEDAVRPPVILLTRSEIERLEQLVNGVRHN